MPVRPQAGGDLVADQEHVVVVAELPDPAQVARRQHPDPRRSLDERLDDHRRDLAVVEVEHALELGGVTGGDVVRVEEQRPVRGVEEVDPADRDGPHGVPVVGVAQADVRGALGRLAALLLPVLEGHLERDLGRRRPGVRVEDPVESRRRDLDQPRRELGGGAVGEAQHRRVGDAVELVADRLVDPGVPVAVDVAPERRDAVDVASAVRVDQVGSLGTLDHERLLVTPALLLGKRMPEVGVIEG